jgi:hypothetical protein
MYKHFNKARDSASIYIVSAESVNDNTTDRDWGYPTRVLLPRQTEPSGKDIIQTGLVKTLLIGWHRRASPDMVAA